MTHVVLHAIHCGKVADPPVNMDVDIDPNDPQIWVHRRGLHALRDDRDGVTRRLEFRCMKCGKVQRANLHKTRAMLWQIREHYVATGEDRVRKLSFSEVEQQLNQLPPLA